MKRTLFTLFFMLLCVNLPIQAQSYVEGISAIIGSGTNSTQIETYSETYETPDLSVYYGVYVAGYLYQNGGLYASGAAQDQQDAYGYMVKPLFVGDVYEIASDHYLVEIYVSYDPSTGQYEYDNPSYFTGDGNAGGGGYSFTPGGGVYYETVQYLYLGSTDVVMSSAAPNITSVNPSSGAIGTSGQIKVNGTDLVDVFTGATTASLPGVSVSVSSQTSTQVVLSYSIASNASAGNKTLTISDRFGSDTANFLVSDPTPVVTSVSPGTWNAGQVTRVTIGGRGFGTAPTVSFNSSSVSSSVISGADTQMVVDVNVSAPAKAQTVTISVQSHGYGSGFIGGQGQSNTGTDTATINPIPAKAPTITMGGTNITGQSKNVVTGQQVALTGQQSLPSGLVVSSFSWSIPGPVHGGYTASQTSGAITPISTSKQSSTMYWVYAGTYSVSYSYCMNNSQCSPSVSATFVVKGPTSTNITPTLNSVHINTFTNSGCPIVLPTKWLQFGLATGTTCAETGTPGIQFKGSATQPGSGTYQWVQLITANTLTVATTTASGSGSCGTGLDNFFPYPTHSATPLAAQDSPGVGLFSTDIDVKRVFAAKMYLLWKSSTTGAVQVPIGFVTWSFSSEGKQDITHHTWSTLPPTSGTAAYTPASNSQNFHGYPTWSTRAANGGCTSQNNFVTD